MFEMPWIVLTPSDPGELAALARAPVSVMQPFSEPPDPTDQHRDSLHVVRVWLTYNLLSAMQCDLVFYVFGLCLSSLLFGVKVVGV